MQAFYESLALDPKVKQQLTAKNAGETLVSLFEDALPKVQEEIGPIAVNMDFLRTFSDIIAPLTVEFAPVVLDQITDQIGRGFYQGLDQNAVVLSLTEKKNNLLMWAHYAQQHKGMVIGFNSDHEFFNKKLNPSDDFRHLRKVSYEQERPTVRFGEDDDFSRILLTKSIEWAYEDEWRMILPMQMAEEVFIHQGEKVHLFPFPPDAVVEIILGARIPDNTRKRVREFMLGNSKYKHAVLQESRLDRKEFKLNFINIPSANGGFRRRVPRQTNKNMANYTAIILWKCDSPESFVKNQYTRGHEWSFDGGVTVPASSSPHAVRVPFSVEAAVDPEEALVASAASCHMLTFLWLAAKAGFNIESYTDNAVGEMAATESGSQWVSKITLDPQIVWIGDKPSTEQLNDLHHHAHEQCFIANSIKSEIVVAGFE